jgi:hypothetical protein
MEFKRTTKDLRERSSFLSKMAATKKVQMGFENMKTHYEIYIENEACERNHSFLDIFEKELIPNINIL